MIEGPFVDGRDMFRPSLMFRVACLAVLLLLGASVEALLLNDVFTDVLVAIEAERRLRGFVEPLVTFRAVFFPFDMSLDHLARHQGSFNGPCHE